MASNLLRNASFEDDTHFVDPNGSIAIPNEWKIVFRSGNDPLLPSGSSWGQPNAGRLHRNNVPPHEHALFFLNGDYCWKVWTESSYAFYFTLGQTLSLTPGARYRFTVNVLPDMVTEYGGDGKVFASDQNLAGARLVVKSGGQTFTTDYFKGDRAPYGRYTALKIDFTAPAAECEVAVEGYGIYGIKNNCYFLDDLSLTQIEAPATTPTPTAPTAPQQFATPAVNLLMNGSFEDGQAYPTDDAKDINVPTGWVFNYHDSATEKLPATYGRPAAALLSRRKAAPADQTRLFLSGNYIWKVTGANTALWVSLYQGVAGLTSGQKYRASAHVFGEAAGGEANLLARTGDQAFTSNWKACAAGQYTRVEFTFTATADRADFTFELRSTAAQPTGAWYVDLLALEPA